MNILWVKIGGLWPLNAGGRLRSFHILSELSRRHRVTVLTTHAPGEDPHALAGQLPDCDRVMSFPYAAPKAGSLQFVGALARSWLSPLPVDVLKWRVPALQVEVARILGSGGVDVCVADFLHAATHVPLEGSVPVVLFAHNVEHMIWKRLAANENRLWRRALLEIEWRKLRRSERLACTRSRSVISVSPIDAACLAEGAVSAQIESIQTGVDTAYFAANGTPEADSHLVFSGAMDWYPNEDAMLFFIAEILPRIRMEIPEVSVTVVGRNPSARFRAAGAAAGIRITGTVDDVRPFIDEGAVYVVPLRIGGGTRLKIFEALSMGKAVVSTTVGAEGLPLNDGEHFVRADAPSDFSRAVVSLLRDPMRRRALGAAGRDLMQARYSWRNVAQTFESHCQNALQQL
ncbi:MAG TPA: glycosyltransferase [Thermoanaerobaculia bacterium]|nr:glycosyltransferase [Thermoanaerobaculia bacterium]